MAKTIKTKNYVYTGSLKDGKPHGKGTLTTYYVEPNHIDGKHAAILFFVFKGNFINGILNGYGEYEFLGSDYYPTPDEAEWFYRKYGKQTYKGEFKDNKFYSGKMIIAKQEGYPKEKIVKFNKFKIKK
tara:strand:- start:1766 stop:2149 length:384 start_codon:yes stop_codon:yes gene_type:complete